ncbi:MAG: hypothetical protein H6597_04545 [Flavobacteriales bacterium]|nr:hypothetical protein [Flavobacteriales bacterium]MCB9193782.1 hypothetical protein [Flavobacteriales bacterium]
MNSLSFIVLASVATFTLRSGCGADAKERSGGSGPDSVSIDTEEIRIVGDTSDRSFCVERSTAPWPGSGPAPDILEKSVNVPIHLIQVEERVVR